MRLIFAIVIGFGYYYIHYGQYACVNSAFVEDPYYWNSSDTRRYPWLKICNEDVVYEIQPGISCSKGLHFPDGGWKPGCLCPHGMWIIKATRCEMQASIVVGDARHGICFKVAFQAESILYVGDPNNVYATKVYVAPLEMSVFYEIPYNGSYSARLDLEKALIIHMFPINNKSIETDTGYCFPVIENNPSRVPVHIWSSAIGPSRYRVVDLCSDPLNFSFDDLLASNIAFTRKYKFYDELCHADRHHSMSANLHFKDVNFLLFQGAAQIKAGGNIVRPRQCLSKHVKKCNKFTTTVRPPQYFTPKYHETHFPDLMKVDPKQKDKDTDALLTLHGPMHKMEVVAPVEGNFSQLIEDEEEELELPVMIDAKFYQSLVSLLSHDDDEEEAQDFGEAVENVLQGDPIDKTNGSSDADTKAESDSKSSRVLPNKVDKKKDESEAASASQKKKKLSSKMLFGDEKKSVTWAHRRTRNIYESLKDSAGEDISGLCTGGLVPPEKCLLNPASEGRNNNFTLSPNNATLVFTNIHMSDGVKYLISLMQNFDKHLEFDDDLMHIASFTDNLAELFPKYCSIPEAIIPASSFMTAMRIMLAHVSLKHLKWFSIRWLTSKDKENIILGNCNTEAKPIELLYQDTCPLKVSCIRYSLSPVDVVKVMPSPKVEHSSSEALSGQDASSQETSSSRMILPSTLDAMLRLLGLMCEGNWEDSQGFHEIKTVFLLLRHVMLKYEGSLETAGSKFNEKNIETFLNISNVPAYFMLLDKCVAAAETISENKHTPLPLLRNSASMGRNKELYRRKRIIEEKQSESPTDDTKSIDKNVDTSTGVAVANVEDSNIKDTNTNAEGAGNSTNNASDASANTDNAVTKANKDTGAKDATIETTTHKPKRKYPPGRIFDGVAICMESYWDGIEKDNKKHQCIPPKSFPLT